MPHMHTRHFLCPAPWRAITAGVPAMLLGRHLVADIGEIDALEVAGSIVWVVQLSQSSALCNMLDRKLGDLALEDVLRSQRQQTLP